VVGKLATVEGAIDMVTREIQAHEEDGSRRGKASFIQIYPELVKGCENTLQTVKYAPNETVMTKQMQLADLNPPDFNIDLLCPKVC
jgi:hypothetical protein